MCAERGEDDEGGEGGGGGEMECVDEDVGNSGSVGGIVGGRTTGMGSMGSMGNLSALNGSMGNLSGFGSMGNMASLGSFGNLSALGSGGNLRQLGSVSSLKKLGSAGNLKALGSASNLKGLGSSSNLKALESASNMKTLGSVGNLKGMGSVGNLKGLGSMGNLASLGSFGNLTTMGSVGNLRQLGFKRIISTNNLRTGNSATPRGGLSRDSSFPKLPGMARDDSFFHLPSLSRENSQLNILKAKGGEDSFQNLLSIPQTSPLKKDLQEEPKFGIAESPRKSLEPLEPAQGEVKMEASVPAANAEEVQSKKSSEQKGKAVEMETAHERDDSDVEMKEENETDHSNDEHGHTGDDGEDVAVGDIHGTTAAKSRRMTADEKKVMLHKRKLRNRQSAARSREKHRRMLQEVIAEIDHLQGLSDEVVRKCDVCAGENQSLREENLKFQRENAMLRMHLNRYVANNQDNGLNHMLTASRSSTADAVAWHNTYNMNTQSQTQSQIAPRSFDPMQQQMQMQQQMEQGMHQQMQPMPQAQLPGQQGMQFGMQSLRSGLVSGTASIMNTTVPIYPQRPMAGTNSNMDMKTTPANSFSYSYPS